jgi:hypothetical protein
MARPFRMGQLTLRQAPIRSTWQVLDLRYTKTVRTFRHAEGFLPAAPSPVWILGKNAVRDCLRLFTVAVRVGPFHAGRVNTGAMTPGL